MTNVLTAIGVALFIVIGIVCTIANLTKKDEDENDDRS